MTGSDNDLGQALLDIEDLKAATRTLRDDLNDEHANNGALVKTARADFERRIDVLRDQIVAKFNDAGTATAKVLDQERAHFGLNLDALRDNTSEVLTALVVQFESRLDALRDQLTTLFAGQINALTVVTKDIRAEARVLAENSKAGRDNLADMLRKRIDDHGASNRAYTAELCAQVAKELDEKFRDVLAKRDATRRN